MKKLYLVPIEPVMVLAEDDEEAIDGALWNHVEYQAGVPEEVNETTDIPDDWVDGVPYGDDTEARTCKQILDDIIEAKRVKVEYDAHPKLELEA